MILSFTVSPTSPICRMVLDTGEQLLVSFTLNDEHHVVPSDRDAEPIAEDAYTAYETGGCDHPAFAGWETESEMEAAIEEAVLTPQQVEAIARSHEAAGRHRVAALFRARRVA